MLSRLSPVVNEPGTLSGAATPPAGPLVDLTALPASEKWQLGWSPVHGHYCLIWRDDGDPVASHNLSLAQDAVDQAALTWRGERALERFVPWTKAPPRRPRFRGDDLAVAALVGVAVWFVMATLSRAGWL